MLVFSGNYQWFSNSLFFFVWINCHLRSSGVVGRKGLCVSGHSTYWKFAFVFLFLSTIEIKDPNQNSRTHSSFFVWMLRVEWITMLVSCAVFERFLCVWYTWSYSVKHYRITSGICVKLLNVNVPAKVEENDRQRKHNERDCKTQEAKLQPQKRSHFGGVYV